jgi:hypothetical protein
MTFLMIRSFLVTTVIVGLFLWPLTMTASATEQNPLTAEIEDILIDQVLFGTETSQMDFASPEMDPADQLSVAVNEVIVHLPAPAEVETVALAPLRIEEHSDTIPPTTVSSGLSSIIERK